MSRKFIIMGLVILIATLVVTAVLYPWLPDRVPTHWNVRGQVDATSPKAALFFFGPGILAATLFSFAVIPWISPRRFKVDTFRSTYEYILVVILTFGAYCYALLLWAA